MKKIALLLLLVLGALALFVRPAGAASRTNPILPTPNPDPQPLVSAS